jgi:hypothetical protein
VALLAGVAAIYPLAAQSTQAKTQAQVTKCVEMDASLRELTNAQNSLNKANHNYEGHRAKAAKLVQQAIAEVKAGLKTHDCQ